MSDTNGREARLPATTRKIRFGTFEVDLDLREVKKRGVRVRLQRKPFQVLEILLKNPGALVRREEITGQLWPDLHVDFDGGLNTAVNSLRHVLGDSPTDCRFIETLPRLGYRFLMPVETIGPGVKPFDVEANQDCLRGKCFYNKLSEDDLRKSIACFESAIDRDPTLATAYAGLAGAHCLAALLGVMSIDDSQRLASQAAIKALQIDNESPDTHASLAGVKTLFDHDWQGAKEQCLRGLQLDPNHAASHRAYAILLIVTGHLPLALQEIRRACALDPLSSIGAVVMAYIFYAVRNFQGAVDEAWKVLAMEPRFAVAQCILGLAYEQQGMIDEATVELQNACSCSSGHPAAIAALGHVYASAGKHDEAWQTLRELDRISQNRSISPYWKGIVYVGVNRYDLALRSLNECLQKRDVWLLLLNVDPRLDALRGSAEFDRLARWLNADALEKQDDVLR